MIIGVIGLGYVGFALSILLGLKHKVYAFDIDQQKINAMNRRRSPFADTDIEHYLGSQVLHVEASLIEISKVMELDVVFIATPTHYNHVTNNFDTTIVESVIRDILTIQKKVLIVIKSTVPVGFTERIRQKTNYSRIIFSPEFLREGKALHDLLQPSRIVVGSKSQDGRLISNLLHESTTKANVPILWTHSTEAEAIKLFSNTYLAMRISFFNELDTFAEEHHLKTKDLIDGVSMDHRIGDGYNNPSFGYGGYCLPKDTRQMLSNYDQIPQNLIRAIIESNHTRKKHIAQAIMKKHPNIVGVYRLSMKMDSDNFRESAMIDIINVLKENHMSIVLFEPMLQEETFLGCRVIVQFDAFVAMSDLIIANRMYSDLSVHAHKVYTRDVYQTD